MSTNATITVKVNEEKYLTIYTHWDGYPKHHMPILKNNYNSQSLANCLVERGDMSVLAEDFQACEYYHRDRGEDWEDVQPREYSSLEEIRESQSYDYYWNGEEWQVGRY